ncbi:MAG TPA: hypothetical protein VGB64_02195 [Actinomycetota bacterium]
MKRKLFVAAVVSLLAIASFAGSARADERLYVSGPGGGLGANYTVPALIIGQGDSVRYRNIDIAAHDVRSTSLGPDRPWCTQFPFDFTPGRCPLFTSKLIGLAGESLVYGIDELVVPQGETVATYPFVCSIHGWMEGTLIVVNPALT